MDIEEAAEFLGVSVKTIRRLVSSGELSARRVKGKRGQRLEFIEEDLITFERRETTHPELLDKDGLEADQEKEKLANNVQEKQKVDKDGPSLGQDAEDVQEITLPATLPKIVDFIELLSKSIAQNLDTKMDNSGPHEEVMVAAKGGQLDNLPDLLTLDEVSKFLRVGKEKVRQLLKSGDLRGIKGMGRGWKVKKEDLRKFVEEL